ncbi:AN1-type zinc finger protein 2B [Armadillidium vulgare]|nr:AN1-type zinc finger protein 2B [Armadillidium vulgare]
MELPHIGEHCSYQGCNQLDFLPVTCNLCSNKFCNDHHRYEDHSCPERHKVDVRVPICPLCEQPVPSKKGLAPDIAVNEHMENNCVQKHKKTKIRCNAQGCRVKELIAIQCDSCQLNFCLRHRHTTDHDCKGPAAARRERTLNGSIFKNWLSGQNSSGSGIKSTQNSSGSGIKSTRASQNSSSSSQSVGIMQVSPTAFQAIQGNMSEEEALRQAILCSQAEGNVKQTPEDEELQKAILESLNEQPQNNIRSKLSSDCSVS